jgi:hypothetical protein
LVSEYVKFLLVRQTKIICDKKKHAVGIEDIILT